MKKLEKLSLNELERAVTVIGNEDELRGVVGGFNITNIEIIEDWLRVERFFNPKAYFDFHTLRDLHMVAV